MSVKNVTMDPKLLSSGKTRSKDSVRRKQNKSKKISKVKQELIRRLKAHEQIKNGLSPNRPDDEDEDVKNVVSDLKNDVNFMDSMQHLNDVIKTARDKKTRKTKKNNKNNNKTSNISFSSKLNNDDILFLETETFEEKVNKNDAPWVSLVPGPSYGNLKNGSKPTYRVFNKTKSKRNRIMFDNKCDTACIPEIDNKLKVYETPVIIQSIQSEPEMKTSIVEAIEPEQIIQPQQVIKPKQTNTADVALSKAIDDHIESKLKKNNLGVPKKHKRKTVRVGRSGDNITFLLKSNTTRKNVKTIEMNAVQEKISNIKRKLIKNKLIKPNCEAPDSILRDMYKTMCITNVDLINERQPTTMSDIIEQ